MQVPLVIYSVHIHPLLTNSVHKKNFLIANSIHKPLHVELFSISKNSSSHSLYTCDFQASFVFLLFLGGLMLHVHVNLVTYSVNTTSSWLSLYTSDVNSLLFSLFASPWWAYHHVIDILWLRALTSGDLFCTYLLSWWRILFIRNHSMAYSVHIPPCVDLFSISTTSSWPSLYTRNFYGLICLFIYTWYTLFIYLFTWCTWVIFYDFMRTYHWWPNLYT